MGWRARKGSGRVMELVVKWLCGSPCMLTEGHLCCSDDENEYVGERAESSNSANRRRDMWKSVLLGRSVI